jgi:hypothetical protein
MKKVVSIVLCITILISISGPTLAHAKNETNTKQVQKIERILDKLTQKSSTPKEMINVLRSLSNAELNMVIDKCKERIEAKGEKRVEGKKGNNLPRYGLLSAVDDYTYFTLTLAWLAAADIAESVGYPLSATLVRYSVLGLDYYEQSGQFSAAIMNSPSFTNLLSSYRNSGQMSYSGSLIFPKNEIADLFFSLHDVSIIMSRYYNSIVINISDKFDFEYWEYDDVWVAMINNWAWLCQNSYILKQKDVYIAFSIQ